MGYVSKKCSKQYLTLLLQDMWPDAPPLLNSDNDLLGAHRWGNRMYSFGADAIDKVRLVPICKVSKSVLGCHLQYAFVRRDSPAMATVCNQFSTCQGDCPGNSHSNVGTFEL